MTTEEKYIAPIFKRHETSLINTLSTNHKFYFKFREPDDLYWGLFCCKIAFYTIDNKLIYYNSKQYAQCKIEKNDKWTFVYYSQSGNIAFFVERNSTKTLAYTFIDLLNKKIFRRAYTNEKEGNQIIETYAKNGYADHSVFQLAENNFQNIQSDKPEFELKGILGLTSWRPEV